MRRKKCNRDIILASKFESNMLECCVATEVEDFAAEISWLRANETEVYCRRDVRQRESGVMAGILRVFMRHYV